MSDQTIMVRGEGGAVFTLSLPLHEAIEDQLRKGTLVRVNKAGEVVTADADVPGLPSRLPDPKAPKAEWVGWAVAQGSTPDDATAMTKADLIEKFGAQG
jgi:hypothetical protein